MHKQENKLKQDLRDRTNSPIQLINQIKGYFYINPFIAISLAITLFSFVGVPPVIGFFAKQMVLSAALDRGYIFMTLIAIITSVIGAGYYLNVVKQIFFFKPDYIKNPSLTGKGYFQNIFDDNIHFVGYILPNWNEQKPGKKVIFKLKNITIGSSLSGSISIITLLLLLFIYMPTHWFNLVNILTLVLFKS